MTAPEKIKLSSDFIFIKLLFSFVAIYLVRLIHNKLHTQADVDFKTSLELRIYLFICVAILVYFFWQPNIYYDDTYLYIKRKFSSETLVPLRKIKCLFNNPLTYKGRTTFTIEYRISENEIQAIKFNIYHYSKIISTFIEEVKQINPKVEII